VWIGAALAAGIILTSFAYGFATRKSGVDISQSTRPL
jgi:hypothetical protein